MEVNYDTYIDLNAFKKSGSTKFAVTGYYGFDWLIREYSYYPSFLSLAAGVEHGPALRDEPSKGDLDAGYPLMYMHSKKLLNRWKALSTIPCYQICSPFVYYRRSRKIERDKDARGTLAFPMHSTHYIDSIFDVEAYMRELKGLPAEFQPVSICIYYTDIARGLHKPFLNQGFKVYTAGHRLDPEFPVRFYDILRRFKYGTSNQTGSYIFYAVEMGIPFSLLGVKGKMFNRGNPSSPQGEFDPEQLKNDQKRQIKGLFEGLHYDISAEQREFVAANLGLDTSTSRLKMFFLNAYAWLKYYIQHPMEPFYRIKKGLARRLAR